MVAKTCILLHLLKVNSEQAHYWQYVGSFLHHEVQMGYYKTEKCPSSFLLVPTNVTDGLSQKAQANSFLPKFSYYRKL